MTRKILVLPGDGIGPEILKEATAVLDCVADLYAFPVEYERELIGGCAIDAAGVPLPDRTLSLARAADSVLLGAVGGSKWDNAPRELRPETGLLSIRKGLGLFANLRPALLFPQLAEASSLRAEVVSGLDMLIIRELTGGIYFGEPRGIVVEAGTRRGFNTMQYTEGEIERIARVGFEAAYKRGGRLCSVDKANVLDVSQLWRQVVSSMAANYPSIELSHMYVDNAAMQLIRAPRQFDVMVTSNLFGDILSDCAAMLTGSIGMLPSASLDAKNKGLYEPVHGSAPDIAGTGKANPLATILSVAMMLRYTFDRGDLARAIEAAVSAVLDLGLRTADVHTPDCRRVSTQEMGAAVVEALRAAAR